MKKFFIFLIILLLIICTICYTYLVYQAKYNNAKQINVAFQKYYNKKIYGADLATAINKAIDYNTKNGIEKNKDSLFIENETNSIKINIKMIDKDNIYPMEKIAASGIENFIDYYNKIQFECIDIQYHTNTNMVKSLLFEQITT